MAPGEKELLVDVQNLPEMAGQLTPGMERIIPEPMKI